MSRFVSGGTNDAPTERDEAWQQAQQKIEAARQQQQQQHNGGSGQQEGGKSLYETLQANKAAKQDAFEESQRLKNQFRALDDDEAAFLHGVDAAARAAAAAHARDTAERLDAFRRRQQQDAAPAAEEIGAAGDGGGDAGAAGPAAEMWRAVPRKRRREGRAPLIGGVKVRRVSGAVNAEPAGEGQGAVIGEGKKEAQVGASEMVSGAVDGGATEAASAATALKPPQSDAGKGSVSGERGAGAAAVVEPPKPRQAVEECAASASPGPAALGLGAYSSDEDE